MSLGPPFFHRIFRVEMLPPLRMKHVKSAHLRRWLKIRSSDEFLLKIFWMERCASHLPAVPPGQPYKPSALIYDALARTYNKEHVRRKNSNVTDVKRYLIVTAIVKDGLLVLKKKSRLLRAVSALSCRGRY